MENCYDGRIFKKEKRSYVMSKIRKKTLNRKYLFGDTYSNKAFRFRVNVKRLPGTPDIVLRKYRSVIFCAWMFLAWS